MGSTGRRKGGLCASHSASWVCWAGFEDLRPKAASPRGTPREGSGSLSPLDRMLFYSTSSMRPSPKMMCADAKAFNSRNHITIFLVYDYEEKEVLNAHIEVKTMFLNHMNV